MKKYFTHVPLWLCFVVNFVLLWANTLPLFMVLLGISSYSLENKIYGFLILFGVIVFSLFINFLTYILCKKLCRNKHGILSPQMRVKIFLAVVLLMNVLLILGVLWEMWSDKRELEDEFLMYHDSCTEIAEVIYADYLECRESPEDSVGYDLKENELARRDGKYLELSEDQRKMLPSVLEGYRTMNHEGLDSVMAGNGYVEFEDFRGNQLIYSVDGKVPDNTRLEEDGFTMTKLFFHWYRYFRW